jgi:hypothetical protein
MPTPQCYETPHSQEGSQELAGASFTREFFVLYQSDSTAALALVEAVAPQTWATSNGNLDRKSIAFRNLGAPDCWLATVTYGSSAAAGYFDPERVQFRVTTATVRITQSKQTLARLQLADMSFAGSNLTVDATDNRVVSPDGYTPTLADVGRPITVTGGSGWTVGLYTITGLQAGSVTTGGTPVVATVVPTKWVLSASPAAAGTAGGGWTKAGTAPAARGANLTANATTPTWVSPAGPDTFLPTAADVGQTLVVTGGTGWAVGNYPIVGFDAGTDSWVLAAGPAAAGTAGGAWQLSGTAPDFAGAIGQSLDTIQGCEIVVPRFELTVMQSYASLSAADLIAFRALVGRTNAAAFLGFPAGQLLYLGCDPTSGRGTLPTGQAFQFWNLAHQFMYEPDVSGAQIGGLTVPSKPGHAYLWVRFAPGLPAASPLPAWTTAPNYLAQRPQAVYVERVYDPGDFSALGVSL